MVFPVDQISEIFPELLKPVFTSKRSSVETDRRPARVPPLIPEGPVLLLLLGLHPEGQGIRFPREKTE